MSKQTDFIERISKLCLQHYQLYDVLPSLTIAQAIEESGWGTSNLFNIANAVFGIKAVTGWSGKVYSTLTKSIHKSLSDGKAAGGTLFRAYDDIEESIIDYYELLQAKRYDPVRAATDYKEACRQVHLYGYCPDEGYDDRLIAHIERYSLYNYDPNKSGTFPFRVKVVYKGKDGVNVRKQPSWSNDCIDNVHGPIHYGDICTVVEKINVDGSYMYKTKSGLYITASTTYIQKA